MRLSSFFSVCFLTAAISGCKSAPNAKPSSEVLQTAQKLAPLRDYNFDQVEVSGTKFYVFTRKDPVLKDADFFGPIKTYWPFFQSRFGIAVSEVAVIDAEGPLSGGPLAPFVLGIFSSRQTDQEFQIVNQHATGWKPRASTIDYIKDQYRNFENPVQQYVTDMIVHELGHIYFGFGLTRVSDKDVNWWFPVGLGLLYDRLAWDQKNKIESPLFSGTTRQWKYFAKLPLDQKLINPDTSRDREFNLPRRQIYVHAKALAFLQALRVALGSAKFDRHVTDLLKVSSGKELNYEDLLTMMSPEDRAVVRRIEIKFQIR